MHVGPPHDGCASCGMLPTMSQSACHSFGGWAVAEEGGSPYAPCPAVVPPPPLQIVVQGIPWAYTWRELKDMFAEIGEIDHADIATGYDGRSRVGAIP